ncbi:1-acyl-sn-glycerol-3-phosphate acyltransferase [Streptomyces sp. NBC_00669]|uniref:1-acyl-sn-glycerol-3-phosphate acyltransferase n=1 Tax=Streptomyces sp. NBC_00669 TaxID=2976011 RepID=UPI002E377E69|nr:1-acyl-sn-glycerol-3-phosphate acyltransferase [Streptomyces sp. NBC_00669]
MTTPPPHPSASAAASVPSDAPASVSASVSASAASAVSLAVTLGRRAATTALLLALIPLTAALLVAVTVLGAPVSLATRGPWRQTRVAGFALLYLLADLAGLVTATVVFLRDPSPRPAARRRREDTAFRTLARLLAVLRRAAEHVFRLRVEVTPAVRRGSGSGGDGSHGDASHGDGSGGDGSGGDASHGDSSGGDGSGGDGSGGSAPRASVPMGGRPYERVAPGSDPRRAPLLVLVRHAGLGDSFLLLQILLTEAGLRPHTVLKGALRADPCLDVLLGRVPHCFVPPASGTAVDGIADLAAGLRPGDALVLFPEGGNFTPRRHRRVIAMLRRRGLYRRAARASRLHYVLPPRDGGALAALAAAPTADVVFVTHAGLDVIDSVRTAWSVLPFTRGVRAHWWRIPAAAIPPGEEARSDWLLTQWERVDRWTAAHAVARTPHV